MANLSKIPIVGKTFGYLTVTEELGRKGKGQYKVTALCICGSLKEYYRSNLTSSRRTQASCGCKKAQSVSNATTTHGLNKHPLYGIWCAMKRRCYNKNAEDYLSYGGRGVKVCDEWKDDFLAYYNWCIKNGWKKGLDIDKDSKGNGTLYSPEWCSIMTSRENQNNRRDNIIVEYAGEEMTLSEFARKYNLKYNRLWKRHITYKWSLKKCLETPVRIV